MPWRINYKNKLLNVTFFGLPQSPKLDLCVLFYLAASHCTSGMAPRGLQVATQEVKHTAKIWGKLAS
jgi:hypothetical protein